ncbi:MAG TPA: hypothetical protein VGX49_04965 [Jatrophihabitans sp.]|jgi:hypothetical protein|nr:hypothetical protein [Jatrophihabitans sp.]
MLTLDDPVTLTWTSSGLDHLTLAVDDHLPNEVALPVTDGEHSTRVSLTLDASGVGLQFSTGGTISLAGLGKPSQLSLTLRGSGSGSAVTRTGSVALPGDPVIVSFVQQISDQFAWDELPLCRGQLSWQVTGSVAGLSLNFSPSVTPTSPLTLSLEDLTGTCQLLDTPAPAWTGTPVLTVQGLWGPINGTATLVEPSAAAESGQPATQELAPDAAPILDPIRTTDPTTTAVLPPDGSILPVSPPEYGVLTLNLLTPTPLVGAGPVDLGWTTNMIADQELLKLTWYENGVKKALSSADSPPLPLQSERQRITERLLVTTDYVLTAYQGANEINHQTKRVVVTGPGPSVTGLVADPAVLDPTAQVTLRWHNALISTLTLSVDDHDGKMTLPADSPHPSVQLGLSAATTGGAVLTASSAGAALGSIALPSLVASVTVRLTGSDGDRDKDSVATIELPINSNVQLNNVSGQPNGGIPFDFDMQWVLCRWAGTGIAGATATPLPISPLNPLGSTPMPLPVPGHGYLLTLWGGQLSMDFTNAWWSEQVSVNF